MRVAVFISGRGSNLQALYSASTIGHFVISAVISNTPKATGLSLLPESIPQFCLDSSRPLDPQIKIIMDEVNADLGCLAGYMKILGSDLLSQKTFINIHPSVLPELKGLHTHEKAIEQKKRTHGASVHWVVPEIDSGTLIIQAETEIRPQETPCQLAARVLQMEHRIYPLALSWIGEMWKNNNKNLKDLQNRNMDPQWIETKILNPKIQLKREKPPLLYFSDSYFKKEL